MGTGITYIRRRSERYQQKRDHSPRKWKSSISINTIFLGLFQNVSYEHGATRSTRDITRVDLGYCKSGHYYGITSVYSDGTWSSSVRFDCGCFMFRHNYLLFSFLRVDYEEPEREHDETHILGEFCTGRL